MFTGIVRHVGKVLAVGSRAGGRRLTVDLGPLAEGLARGDSVAVAGVCLTVAAVRGSQAEFDLGAETLAKTTLAGLAPPARVNLERPLQLADGLDGHIVLGHVDGPAEVRAVHTGDQHVIEFAAAPYLLAQMVEKGSVCIDGVSLTLVNVTNKGFSVALIPQTLSGTTLGQLQPGAKVNIETDVIGKYVLKHLSWLSDRGGGITLEKLGQVGFL